MGERQNVVKDSCSSTTPPEGTSKGVEAASRIESAAGLRSVGTRRLREYRQPVLVETCLPGQKFTVGLLGTGDEAFVAGITEVLLENSVDPAAYTFRGKVDPATTVDYHPADDPVAQAAALALAAWRALGCRDGGRVNVRANATGAPQLIEVNPLAGLRPGRSDLFTLWEGQGKSCPALIENSLQSALKRL